KRLRAVSMLESLDLTGSRLTVGELDELRELPMLRKLTLKNTGLDDSAIEALAKLSVVELSIEGTQISLPAMTRLRESRPPIMTIKPPTLQMRIQFNRQWNTERNDFQPRRLAAEFLRERGAEIE